jgi:hypothetical protein
LQDVLARLDTPYHKPSSARLPPVFRPSSARLPPDGQWRGEQPGFPRLQGRDRDHACTDKEYGNGARRDNGALVLSQIGRIAVRWSRAVEGTIKTVTVSKEADGW